MSDKEIIPDHEFLTSLNALAADGSEQRQRFVELQERWKQEEEERKIQAKNALFDALRNRLEIAYVQAKYDGSGDSGQIAEIAYFDHEDREFQADDQALHDSVEEYVYSLLPTGWEINEGGFGTVEIDVAARKAHVAHSQRIMNEYTEEFDN